jgi:beta-lactam-binding protein with PASTA domain
MQSDRPLSFSVTSAGGNVKLDDSGEAKASFTVTNASSRAVTGELLAKPREPAKPEWFSVVGESIREFTPNAAEGVVVKLDVPPGSAPGSYSFRLDAVNEDDPDEDYTEGPFVGFDVAAPPAQKKFPWWILIVAGAILLILIGVIVWLLVRDSGPKSAAVPAVISMSARAADSTLTNAGFTVKTRSVPVKDPTQNGDVQDQDPAAGSAQPPGTAVTISVGQMSRVPSVKGLDETKAKAALADADLNVTVRHVGEDDPARSPIVVDQDPPAGTLQRPGAVVTLTVGRKVPVPDVRGKSLTEAELTLWYAEHLDDPNDALLPPEPALRSNVSWVEKTHDQTGIVQSQNPSPGTLLPHGSVVELRVGFAY